MLVRTRHCWQISRLYVKSPQLINLSPASFSFIFGLFQANNTIFTTNQCEKCHVHLVYAAVI